MCHSWLGHSRTPTHHGILLPTRAVDTLHADALLVEGTMLPASHMPSAGAAEQRLSWLPKPHVTVMHVCQKTQQGQIGERL